MGHGRIRNRERASTMQLAGLHYRPPSFLLLCRVGDSSGWLVKKRWPNKQLPVKLKNRFAHLLEDLACLTDDLNNLSSLSSSGVRSESKREVKRPQLKTGPQILIVGRYHCKTCESYVQSKHEMMGIVAANQTVKKIIHWSAKHFSLWMQRFLSVAEWEELSDLHWQFKFFLEQRLFKGDGHSSKRSVLPLSPFITSLFPPLRTRDKRSQNRQEKKHNTKESQLSSLLKRASIRRNISVTMKRISYTFLYFLHLLNPDQGQHPPWALCPPPYSNFLSHHSPGTPRVTFTYTTKTKLTTTPTHPCRHQK